MSTYLCIVIVCKKTRVTFLQKTKRQQQCFLLLFFWRFLALQEMHRTQASKVFSFFFFFSNCCAFHSANHLPAASITFSSRPPAVCCEGPYILMSCMLGAAELWDLPWCETEDGFQELLGGILLPELCLAPPPHAKNPICDYAHAWRNWGS